MHNFHSGDIVEFGKTVEYVCNDGFYFEEDRNKEKFDLLCKEDGSFDVEGASICYDSKT